MRFRNKVAWLCTIVFSVTFAIVPVGGWRVEGQNQAETNRASDVSWVTASELKDRLARNEPITIVDVRSTDSFIDSDGKIKGALRVKGRRLRHRLTLPPLKDLARDTEIVTYCACPNDEASIRAAQLLTASGFKRARVLKGGWQAWLSARGPVDQKPGV